MGYLFKQYISDEIVESKFQDKYGKKYKLKLDIEYQFEYRKVKIDIGFTADKKAFWIFKYNGEYYMNIIEDIELKDKYTILDIYTTLMENATHSLSYHIGLKKMRKQAKK